MAFQVSVNQRSVHPFLLLFHFFGFGLTTQHYLTMIGAIVSIPFILTPALCMENEDPARGLIISTMIFVTGIVTYIQVTWGCRMPIVQVLRASLELNTVAVAQHLLCFVSFHAHKGRYNFLFGSRFGHFKSASMEMSESRRNEHDVIRRKNRIMATSNAWDIGRYCCISSVSTGHRVHGLRWKIIKNNNAADHCANCVSRRTDAVSTCWRDSIEALGNCGQVYSVICMQ